MPNGEEDTVCYYRQLQPIIFIMSFSAVFFWMLGIAAAAKLPDQFPRCKRSDLNLNECLRSAIQESIPQLVKGVPKLGLLTIDPLRVSALNIYQGDGPVAIDLKFKDLDFKNLASIKINGVKADLDNYLIDLETNIQKPLILTGDYEIKGKIMVVPISGKGKAQIQLDDLKAVLTLKGKELKKDGHLYMELVDVMLKFQTSRLHSNFGNLFNGDKALGDNMNKFLNENWKEILQELQPSFEDALSATFKELARRLFSKVPYDEIFLR